MKILILILIQNLVMARIQIPFNGLDLFNNMMRYLLKNCGPEFGTIGFWGNDRIFLADDEADFVLFNKNEVSHKEPARRIKSLVEIYNKSNLPEFELYHTNITLEIDKMFVFAENDEYIKDEFSWFQKRFKNSRFYYCFERQGKIIVQTLNTFGDFAPGMWTKIGEQVVDNNTLWIWRIYQTQYDQKTKFYSGPNICENFFFDRTKNLNGYTIIAIARMMNYYDRVFYKLGFLVTKSSNISHITATIHPIDGQLAKALADYLDIGVNISYGMPYKGGPSPTKLIRDGKVELDLISENCQESSKNSQSVINFYTPYPLTFFYDVIVTHNRGLMSPLEKMFEFYGWLTIIATLIILFITFIVIYFAKHKKTSRISFAVFECLRLLINNSMVTRMDTNKIRIFFSVIFLYFLIIQATFSGHLAAFLTKPVYRKNVETLEDLKDSSYWKIHVPFEAKYYIEDQELLNKTIFGDYQCVDFIADPKIACIDQESNVVNYIANENLQTPKNPVKFNYAAPVMHHNWALRHRVNNLIMRLAQSGISDLWHRNLGKSTEELKKIKAAAKNFHRPIEVQDIIFAIFLLAFGLFLASFCFTAEFFIKIFKLHKRKFGICSSYIKKLTITVFRFVGLKFQQMRNRFI